MSWIHFEILSVYNELKNLESKFSSGPDGLPNFVLKNWPFFLSEPLFYRFPRSFEDHELPNDWLLAIVVPIFKRDQPRILAIIDLLA